MPNAYKIPLARILRTTTNTYCYNKCGSNIKFGRWLKCLLTPWHRHCKVSTSRGENFFGRMAKAKDLERVVVKHKYSTAKVNTFLGDWAYFNYPECDVDKRACHVGLWVFLVCENAEWKRLGYDRLGKGRLRKVRQLIPILKEKQMPRYFLIGTVPTSRS